MMEEHEVDLKLQQIYKSKTIGVCVCVQSLSHVQFFVMLRNTACQPPLSMGFSWQEYWSGLPFLSRGDLPHPGIKPAFLTLPILQMDSLLPVNP